ncbi:MAG: 2-amino-4-hydroxy-6-hydroxymethyldihydropteridine diphosphokinase [bacterium]
MTRAAVGFGGNVGRPDLAFARAVARLEAEPGMRVVARSRLWESEAWGRTDQPPFLNAAALIETSASPAELHEVLRDEERAAGRVRAGERWGPRTLDLDILWFGDQGSDDPELVLPHPRLAERSFVLEPLAEIAPDWRHPRTGASAAEMLAALRAAGQASACERTPVLLGEPLGALPCRR